MRIALAVALFALTAFGCSRGDAERGSTSEAAHGAALRDLTSVETFRARFDADSAQPRLVLLLSPT